MKNQLSRLALVGTAALLLNVGWVKAADTTATQPSTPGTPSETDTKSQENNPAGPNKQKVASMPSNTKKHHKHPKGTQPVANQSPDPATKTPQVSMPTTTP